MNDEWLSLSDAAKLLGVHPSTVRLWSDKGVLPTHRTSGGHRRYRRPSRPRRRATEVVSRKEVP